jgi:hypothetical protein
MLAASDPNQIVIGFGIGAMVLAALWRLIVWVRDAPLTPDPWDADVERQLQEAPETCPHCSTPQPPNAWFCQHCGRAVGPYNNLMPYLQIFSEGEVLRNSAQRHFRNRPLVMIGYFLLGLAFIPFFLLPVYWFSLVQKWKQPGSAPKSIED